MTKNQKIIHAADLIRAGAIPLTMAERAFIKKYGITHQTLTGETPKVIGISYESPTDHHSTVTPEDIAAMESLEAKFPEAKQSIIHITIKEKST